MSQRPDGRHDQSAPRRRSAVFAVGGLLLALVLVVVTVGVIRAVTDRPADAPTQPPQPTGTPAQRSQPPPAQPPRWTVLPRDVLTGGNHEAVFTTGNQPRTDIRDDTALTVEAGNLWVVMADDAEQRTLAGIEPGQGEVVWTRDLDWGQCSTTTTGGGAIVCLAESAGAITGHLLDPATGGDLASWTAQVTGPWGVHVTDAGLLVMDESEPRVHSMLTLLDLDTGEALWSTDTLDLVTGEWDVLEWVEHRGAQHNVPTGDLWDAIGDAVLLRTADAALFIDPVDRSVTYRDCPVTVLAEDRLACQHHAEVTMYDSRGERLWSAPTTEVELANNRFPSVEVFGNHANQRVWHTDWDDGTVGTQLAPLTGASAMTGTPQIPVVISSGVETTEVIRLTEDQSQILWRTETRGSSRTGSVVVVEDVAVLTSLPITGLDLATGKELWTQPQWVSMSAIDGVLVTFDHLELSRFDLP